jgi:hypothetical protein
MSISPTGPLSTGSLTSAARRAVQDIERINHEVDGIASNVAGQIGEIAKIPALAQQAKANVRVFETADTLLSELASTARF